MLVAPSFLTGHSTNVFYVCNCLHFLLRKASAVADSELKRRVRKKKKKVKFCAWGEIIGKVVHVHTIKAYERAQSKLQTFLNSTLDRGDSLSPLLHLLGNFHRHTSTSLVPFSYTRVLDNAEDVTGHLYYNYAYASRFPALVKGFNVQLYS